MKKNSDNELRKQNYETADSDEKLIMNFRDINHTMHSLYEGRGSQSSILIILLEKESITQQELTEQLGIKPGSASEVIAKLEKNGMINRTKSIFDRRTANITLTDEGRKSAQEAKTKRLERHNEMFSALSKEEKSSLLSLLEKINSDWEKLYSDERKHHGKDHHHKNHHGNHHNHDGKNNKDCDGNCRECPHPCH